MKKKKGKPAPPSVAELVPRGQQHVERGELAEAEACFRQALALAPGHLGVITLLGLVRIDRDDPDGAIDLLEPARDAAPDFAPIQLALGSAYAMAGHDEIAVVAMETAAKLDGESTHAFERLAKHHVRAGRPREAIAVVRRLLRRDPTNEGGLYMLEALTGEKRADVPAESPPAMVAELFDSYATKFDEHLAKLEYRVPAQLVALITEVDASTDRVIVDLGCGTGLAGVELRASARTLVGCDLSPRMIARAKERSIYDELYVEDLRTTLARTHDVDLIVAADVFIYLGALDTTFAACVAALRPGGLLAFSTEIGEGDVTLQTTFRYAHSEAYIRGLADANGLTIARMEPTILRMENEQPIRGMLHVFRR